MGSKAGAEGQRTVNPDDLDQLAKLLEGKGGVQDKIDEAFTRAGNLGVSSKLTALRPMRSWVTTTAPDLRKRAALGRLEDGDPQAGAKWAGFDAKDLAKGALIMQAPDVLLLANAIASSDSPDPAFRRRSRESLDDWVDRLRAHAFASIPALRPYEKDIENFLGLYGDVTGFVSHAGSASFHTVNLTKVLVGNSIAEGGWANTAKMYFAGRLQAVPGSVPASAKLIGWGERLEAWTPPIRSLAAPGTWLPGKLSALASGSAAYQDASSIPTVSGYMSTRIGMGVDWIRRSGVMTTPRVFGISGNSAIDFLVGSDRLARMYGGLTHSGQIPGRAANASLIKVTSNAAADARLFGSGRLAALGKGLSTAGKAGGFLRGAGVAGGVFSTAYSVGNVWAQGNPASHFTDREHGAKYVADVAEVGFNASLTAATIAPNPFTLGALAVTGAIYGGAKIVEHWDGIKDGGKKAAHWVGEKAGGLASGAKNLAKKANPMHWF
ncbi:PE-PGRS family protein [Streptomyces sp. ASQP_92]|uniref:PE-PGRS family protein n=1 Tax=Streptomyces sp. ASQP_92 TaxID=2979116 RepID=UPI0021BF043E|nr:PE-PGRS family protein [Streptomyces sp. ASQP_92]MCT9089152.1 PE-PGRS family protein [Streptomyces sp. ASQP_92]